MNSVEAILLTLAVKATVILAAAILASWALRRASASARRFVWVSAAICVVALPVLNMLPSPLPVSTEWRDSVRLLDAVQNAGTRVMVPASRNQPPNLPWVAYLWTAGFLAVIGRWAAGEARMWWITRSSLLLESVDGASELEAQLGAGPVRYVESPRIAMPMTWGVLRPMVLLPASRIEWPAERLRLVLAHELIHVRSRDCLVQMLMQIACALYWFHPLMWLAASRFRRERERACDDGVLRLGINGPDYAVHLLELVRSLKPGPALAVAMAHQSNLEGRLVALLDVKTNRARLSRRATILATLAAAFALLPLATIRGQEPAGTGTVAGIVYDPSGAIIPGANVLATNLNGSNKERAVSNAIGEYTLKAIPAGHYLLEISTPGFRLFQRKDVSVGVNENPRIDGMMEIGNISERLEVTAQKSGSQTPQSDAPHRIRVGGNVMPARLVSRTLPEYPEYAKEKGIEGSVLMQAIISKQGSVLSLSVLNSADSDLAQAAKTAVQQWRYEPTLLNGHAVEVVTTITVDFRLK